MSQVFGKTAITAQVQYPLLPFFLVFLRCLYTPVFAAPIPVVPAHPLALSLSHFPEQNRNTFDPRRLLLLHDIPLKDPAAEGAAQEALAKAKEEYPDVLQFIEGAF